MSYSYLTTEDIALSEAMLELRHLVRLWIGRWYVRNGSLCNRKAA